MEKKAGRPSKLTENFLVVAKKVIDEYILACTDEEILWEINERLPEKERICDATWENWKAGKFTKGDTGRAFLGLIKKALNNQKRALLGNLSEDDKQWQRWAWIIERKFDDWNIRHKQDVDQKNSGTLKLEIVDSYENTP